MKPMPLAILAVILTPVPTLHAQSSPCSCQDLNEIKHRLGEVDVAIREFTSIYVNVSKTESYSDSEWEKLEQGRVHKALVEFKNPYPSATPGRTAGFTDRNCQTHIPPDVNPCIRQALDLHEKVHRDDCLSFKGKIWVWKDDQPLVAAVMEEIQAYTRERNFLLEQKRRLECSCPYYAIHFNYLGFVDIQNRTPLVARQVTATPVPVEIPITLKDDGTFSGEAEAVLQGDGTLRSIHAQCQATDQGLVRLRASGTIAGPENSPQMHLEVSNESPPVTSQVVNCMTNLGPYHGASVQTGNNATLPFDMPAVVGEQKPAKLLEFGRPTIGLFVSLTAAGQIAETPEKAAMTAAETWGNQTPSPDALPVCKAKP